MEYLGKVLKGTILEKFLLIRKTISRIVIFLNCQDEVLDKMVALKVPSMYQLYIYEIFKKSLKPQFGQSLLSFFTSTN